MHLYRSEGASKALTWTLSYVGGCTMRQADTYREWAEECRQSAYRAVRPQDEAFWLRWADDWKKLAEECERTDPSYQVAQQATRRSQCVIPH